MFKTLLRISQKYDTENYSKMVTFSSKALGTFPISEFAQI